MFSFSGTYEETSFNSYVCRHTNQSESFCTTQMRSLFSEFHPEYNYLNVSQPYCITFTRSEPDYLKSGDPQPTVTLGFRRCLIYGYYDCKCGLVKYYQCHFFNQDYSPKIVSICYWGTKEPWK
ncbi:hypothetical protein WDU94_010065 [Cyamophila willieti]